MKVNLSLLLFKLSLVIYLPLSPWKVMHGIRMFFWSLICELMKKSSLIRNNDGQTSKALEIMFGSNEHPERLASDPSYLNTLGVQHLTENLCKSRP